MNFKLLLLLFILIGCGVKNEPRNTSSIVFKSYQEQYQEDQMKSQLPDQENKKKSNQKK